MKLIRRGGVNPSGLVLNFVPQKGGSGYYFYHSDKSYYGITGSRRRGKALKLLTASRQATAQILVIAAASSNGLKSR